MTRATKTGVRLASHIGYESQNGRKSKKKTPFWFVGRRARVRAAYQHISDSGKTHTHRLHKLEDILPTQIIKKKKKNVQYSRHKSQATTRHCRRSDACARERAMALRGVYECNGSYLCPFCCKPREPSLYRRSGPFHLKQISPDFVRKTVDFLLDFNIQIN